MIVINYHLSGNKFVKIGLLFISVNLCSKWRDPSLFVSSAACNCNFLCLIPPILNVTYVKKRMGSRVSNKEWSLGYYLFGVEILNIHFNCLSLVVVINPHNLCVFSCEKYGSFACEETQLLICLARFEFQDVPPCFFAQLITVLCWGKQVLPDVPWREFLLSLVESVSDIAAELKLNDQWSSIN